ncbi:MAG: tetratricopeptide repeat protein [Prevotellaceae bacterium]|nr:tetratricopeptide repeat protein [Prevotellaceae bacterium]
MKIFYFIVIFLAQGVVCRAAQPDSLKVSADSAYAAEDYHLAARLYSQAEPTAAVCYNLGNCYYRLDEMARAVLWYERASMLDPSDADIRFNLGMARGKTIDKVVPKHEIFFVNWYTSLVNVASVDEWGRLSLAFFACALVCLVLCVTLRSIVLKKISLSAFAVLLVFTVVGNVCAFSQRYRLLHRTGAIVMDASAVVKSTPSSSGSDLFVLHEGTKVEIKDSTLSDWYEIELADGKVGWIESRQIEII